MQRWSPLNIRQVALLRRIGDGDDLSGPDGVAFRTSARGLQTRHLVQVSRSGGAWRASITDAGQFYLQHGHHPDHPDRGLPRSAGRQTPTTATLTSEEEPRPQQTTSAVQSPAVAFARELIEQLQREGGTLRIVAPDEPSRASYRRAIHAAKQHRLVPPGHQLKHTGRGQGELIIRLAADSPAEETDWNRIRLNTRRVTTDPELVRTALEMDPAGLNVTPASVPRAINLLYVLASQAENRSLRIGANTKTRHPKVFLQVDTTRRDITVHEEYDTVPHVLTREEQHALRRRPWMEFDEFDRVASGRLRLEVARSGYGKVDTWTDEETSPIERRLAQILEEIEEGVAADERARLEQERAHQAHLAELDRRERETRRQWQAALDKARPPAEEAVRKKLFGHAYQNWITATKIRAFCEAIESGTAGPNQSQWTAWARAAADSIDPTIGENALAHSDFDVTVKADDLRPYLGEWSADEPRKEYRSPKDQQRIDQARTTADNWHHRMGTRAHNWLS